LSYQPTNIQREDIEWCDIWVTKGTGTALPRALLIGDSIVRAYYPDVNDRLGDRVAVSRISTSKSIGDPLLVAELALVLCEYEWDVVHFNNGLHGWGYSEEEYKAHFPEVVAAIRSYAPKAKLIWATTTPIRENGNLEKVHERNARVIVRNRDAAEIVSAAGIPTNDLYAVVDGQIPYYSQDGVHFSKEGSAALAAVVANAILAAV
jgi:hypothetical protein